MPIYFADHVHKLLALLGALNFRAPSGANNSLAPLGALIGQDSCNIWGDNGDIWANRDIYEDHMEISGLCEVKNTLKEAQNERFFFTIHADNAHVHAHACACSCA